MIHRLMVKEESNRLHKSAIVSPLGPIDLGPGHTVLENTPGSLFIPRPCVCTMENLNTPVQSYFLWKQCWCIPLHADIVPSVLWSMMITILVLRGSVAVIGVSIHILKYFLVSTCRLLLLANHNSIFHFVYLYVLISVLLLKGEATVFTLDDPNNNVCIYLRSAISYEIIDGNTTLVRDFHIVMLLILRIV